MTEKLYREILEAIRIQGERPSHVQYEEMIADGVIDREGNCLLRFPDFPFQHSPGSKYTIDGRLWVDPEEEPASGQPEDRERPDQLASERVADLDVVVGQ